MLETLPMWSDVQSQLQPHPFRMKLSNSETLRKASRRTCGFFPTWSSRSVCFARTTPQYILCPKHDIRPTVSFAVRAPTPGICF